MNAKQRWKNRETAADLAWKVHRCAKCGARGPNHYIPRRQVTIEDVIKGTVDECGEWWCAQAFAAMNTAIATYTALNTGYRAGNLPHIRHSIPGAR